jgi:hypothetical protein
MSKTAQGYLIGYVSSQYIIVQKFRNLYFTRIIILREIFLLFFNFFAGSFFAFHFRELFIQCPATAERMEQGFDSEAASVPVELQA